MPTTYRPPDPLRESAARERDQTALRVALGIVSLNGATNLPMSLSTRSPDVRWIGILGSARPSRRQIGSDMIEMKQIEVLSEASNMAVVRMPGRKFPGIVIQGDSLSILASAAEIIRARVPAGHEVLREAAEELCRLLTGRLTHYEKVLRENGIKLPYESPSGSSA